MIFVMFSTLYFYTSIYLQKMFFYRREDCDQQILKSAGRFRFKDLYIKY